MILLTSLDTVRLLEIEHLAKQHPEAVEVRSRVDGLPSSLLRTHVRRRTGCDSGLGQSGSGSREPLAILKVRSHT
jgi:hypothetical protein